MKKLLTSLVLVLVLCLACGIAFAAQDAVSQGESYGTLTYNHNGKVEKWGYGEYIVLDDATCTTAGSAKAQCHFDNETWHIMSIPARGHGWDVSQQWVKDIWNRIRNNYNNHTNLYISGWSGAVHYEQDKADPCLFHLSCVRKYYDANGKLTYSCDAEKDWYIHYWSSETGIVNWGKVTEKYSCTAGGQAEDYCVICGTSHAKYRDIDPLGHDFGEYVIVSYPHCEKGDNYNEYKVVDGQAKLVCKRCGADAAEGDKVNGNKLTKEDLTKKIKYDATTKTAAMEATKYGLQMKKADADALAKKFPSGAKASSSGLHDFDGPVEETAATCEKGGTKVRWCLRCGSNYTIETPALGHNFEKAETLVNCFDARTDFACTRCGVLLTPATYQKMYDKYTEDYNNVTETDPAKKLAKQAEILAAQAAFANKYKSVKDNTNIQPVKAHSYDLKDAYLVTKDTAAKWGLNYNEVYDAYHADKADCVSAEYKAYICVHFNSGVVGSQGEKHGAKEGITYVKVKDALGHNWTPWEKVYDPGDGENKTGLYVRHCTRCPAWENRHSEVSPVIEATDANGFVLRLFKALLGEDDVSAVRVAEWADPLAAGTTTAAQTVAGFVGSEAFAAKDLDNAAIVDALYAAMLGRPANDGKAGEWVELLNSGVSTDAIINGFAGSEEFKEFAEEQGFEAGQLAVQSRDVNPRITAFVERCYNTTLERPGEEGGLNYWTSELLNGVQSPKQVATGFVFSAEYDAANKIADEEKVEGVVYDLYNLYLGRTPSDVEADWYVDLLNNGMKLDELNHMFADSVEFENIVKSFGLSTEW